jgi:hypothetical protein
VPRGITGNGILSNSAANPFANWTKVYANYCSSDQWIGRRQALAVSAINRANGSTVPYEIPFLGAVIFDQLLADLRSGVTACMGAAINCQALPSLTSANAVVLAGSSAGGLGVLHNADRLRDQQSVLNPATQVRALVDGASPPPSVALPWPAVPTPAVPYTSYQQMIDARAAGVYNAMWLARVDDSCAAENAGTASRCADGAHVIRHHLTTPFFVRQDQQDSLMLFDYWSAFFPAPAYAAGTAAQDLSTGTAGHLTALAAMSTLLTPRYPNELATIAADPQWLAPTLFGPRCGDHTGLTGAPTLYAQELPSGGVPINLATALAAWVATAPGGIAGAPANLMLAPTGIGPIPGAPCN